MVDENIKQVLIQLSSEDFIGEYIATEIIGKYPDIKEKFYQNYFKLNDSEKINLYKLFSFLKHDEKLIEFSLRTMEENENDTVKASILIMLGEIGDVNIIPRLSKFLKHKDRRVRANTVEALSKIGDRKIIDLLLPLLGEEKDNRVLANTAIALWKFEDIRENVKHVFRNMIDDNEKWMRASALYAFGETKIDDFMDFLFEAVGDEDEDICRNAVIALIGYSELLSKKQ